MVVVWLHICQNTFSRVIIINKLGLKNSDFLKDTKKDLVIVLQSKSGLDTLEI